LLPELEFRGRTFWQRRIEHKARTRSPNAMLQDVALEERSIADYRAIAPDWLLDSLVEAARPLRGARVLQLNATAYGGGVAELLRSMVPLLRDLGVDADWKVISADDDFFRVTKTLHNALQGSPHTLGEHDRAVYERTAARNMLIDHDYDFIVVHDPQPAALAGYSGSGNARWIWRCHIDMTTPNSDVWTFVRSYLDQYEAAVFTLESFVPSDIPIERIRLIPPAIDPLSEKNRPLDPVAARAALERLRLRPDRPLVTQVSRFDPWKDPLGVIEAYRLAREEVPELELALVGSMAADDPEGAEVHRRVAAEAERDSRIHVLTDLCDRDVNAIQRLSNVVVQKSIREGFGLVVSEALWKETPVVATAAGGMQLQIGDGAGGILVRTVEETARATAELVTDVDRGAELARRGRERVRERFALPRLLLDELRLLGELAA
jgi:trehalose synthase